MKQRLPTPITLLVILLLALTSSCSSPTPDVRGTAAIEEPGEEVVEETPGQQPPASSSELRASCEVIDLLGFCYEYTGLDWTVAQA